MSDQFPLRVLLCIGINQNFFDLERSESGSVWRATLEFLEQTREHPGIRYLHDFDDDSHQVGPSSGWPWTAYVLVEANDQATVREVVNLFRTISVGDHALYRYAQIEARIGRPLTVRDDVTLPEA